MSSESVSLNPDTKWLRSECEISFKFVIFCFWSRSRSRSRSGFFPVLLRVPVPVVVDLTENIQIY